MTLLLSHSNRLEHLWTQLSFIILKWSCGMFQQSTDINTDPTRLIPILPNYFELDLRFLLQILQKKSTLQRTIDRRSEIRKKENQKFKPNHFPFILLLLKRIATPLPLITQQKFHFRRSSSLPSAGNKRNKQRQNLDRGTHRFEICTIISDSSAFSDLGAISADFFPSRSSEINR